ncbi:MAG: HpcH/HpaI aldolase family protein [Spirochaetota bacterium]
MRQFTFKQRIRDGETLIGTWIQMLSPESVEMAAAAGFDFVVIDTEHGFFEIGAAGTVPLVRVARRDPTLIGKALDQGAEGTVYPGVSTRQEAREAAAGSRYAPDGNRGACPFVRATDHLARDWQGFAQTSNEGAVSVMLIEGAEGVQQVDEIVAIPGVDAVMLGPFDLSVALGVAGETEHPKVLEAFARIISSAREHGVAVIPNIFETDNDEARRLAEHWRSEGAGAVLVGTDKMLLADAFARCHRACTRS